ncbi:hypothetical protein PG988_015875 [Apiospora saccharicola]
MHAAFFTALALGGLVTNTIASPIEAAELSPEPYQNITTSEVQGYGGGDYSAQGKILELLLDEIIDHADIIDSILGGGSKNPKWGESLKLIRMIAPQLGAVAGLLNGLEIIGKKKSPYVVAQDDVTGLEYMVEADFEVAVAVDVDVAGGGRSECNKLCVFDLISKILMQVYGIAFSVVKSCGLGFSFQYLSPIVLKLVKKLTMLDMVVGGVLEVSEPLISKILGMIRLSH